MIRVNDRKRLRFLDNFGLVMLTVLALCFGSFTPVNASQNHESASESATYIVVLKDKSLARYSGGVAGYAATSLQAVNATSGKRKAKVARKLNARSPESVSYLSYLASRRGVAIKSANDSIGRDLDVSYEYGATIVGFAAEMTDEEARRVGSLDQVEFVELEKISYLHTDAGPVWSGAAGVWSGQNGLNGTLGEGIIVGIIDTGIDPWNPSFLGTGGDGYVHTNPKGAGNYIGVCDSENAEDVYDASFDCNEKLIGAWSYPLVAPTARDSNGHGSHTAGTAAGNIVFDAVVEAPTKTFTADISGVAPHANIIAYAACCSGSALTAARDQALLDGVDVINYSIGSSGPTGDFWGDSEAIQWLALRDAGVFVATSNGNAGNGDATTGSPSDLPWLTSVGANSHNRSFLVTLTLSDTTNAQITVSGQAMTSGYGPAGVVFSNSITDTDETRLCAPGAFDPETFNGEIVICERGTYGRVAKGQSVLNGGAGGFILAQAIEETGGPGAVAADTHVLPAAHIDYNEYQKLRQFILTDSIGTVTGVLSGASLDFDDVHGDIMASFSSRGPNGSDADLIVPNVTAPGRAILAAYHQGDADGDHTYNVIQGTSMSSPHVAGAAALLSALHPDWTPAEMQSALMMTARDTVLDDDATTVATPFAQGSGHINVYLAAQSPLIMDVTKAQYDAADPDVENGFGVRDLNIPSLGNNECIGSCSWTRSVENASDEALSWTVSFDGPAGFAASVSPPAFTLDPGESQEIEIELNVNSITVNGEWQFGSFDFDETSGNYPNAHWPFAVIPNTSNIPETLDIETRTTSGSVDMVDLVSRDISNFHTDVTGLKKADRHAFTLIQDNNTGADFPDIFFDDQATTQFIPITVPADSFSVIADIVDTASPDLDMLLFLDADANGPDLADVGDPEANPDACQSASGGSAEFCEILSPTAGTYYVAIINYSQATDGGDPVDLATAVIPANGADEGNLTVSGPTTVSDGSPYSITVGYDEPGMTAIDKLYGYFTVGSDPGNAGNVATVRVGLEYLGTPDIDINPTALAATVEQQASLTQTLTISATEGVLDWNVVTTGGGVEAVQDGSFELGRETNPYWRDGASLANAVPICSLASCGADLASDGEWYLWMGGVADHTSYAEQDITVASGDVANLTFEMLMGTNPAATATLTISMDGTSIAVFTEADLGNFSASYTTVNIDASAYADGASHLLRFDFENPTTENFNMFIDQVSVVSGSTESLCKGVGAIDWLDASPLSGTLSPGQTDLVVTYDATGLAPGIYTENMCVASNDPDEPILSVPVTMTVVRPDRMFSDGFEG